MLDSMGTINDEYMSSKHRPCSVDFKEKHTDQKDELNELAPMHHLKTLGRSTDSVTKHLSSEPDKSEVVDTVGKAPQYLDVPLLISDHDGEDSEGDAIISARTAADETDSINSALSATQDVKRSIKKENKSIKSAAVSDSNLAIRSLNASCSTTSYREPVLTATSLPHVSEIKTTPNASALVADSLKCERNKVMKIVVKYVAMKITNSFPPPSSRTIDHTEMPLDEYLMILVSRLQLSLPSFMKGVIYLFRYMDIIYFLRYVNQSNNFANYTDMGYGLKKLIIGCFRLVLARERRMSNWSGITGLSNAQINDIVKTLVSRLNGKLSIKSAELISLRGEIFRFVQMVTKVA